MPETIVEKIYQIIRGSSFDDAPEDAEAIFKAVLDDQREWADSGLNAWRLSIARRVIDAYEKDRS